MRWNKRRTVLTVLVVLGVAGIWATVSEFVLAESTPPKAEKSRANGKESIAETKKKGFEGVDFSYDVFGAPPGQDPAKFAEQSESERDRPRNPRCWRSRSNCWRSAISWNATLSPP